MSMSRSIKPAIVPIPVIHYAIVYAKIAHRYWKVFLDT